ncbi:hypothetical protein GGE45_002709 [Rhizobium aethiopicum]|uniref:hypothetical protein n=1 Tax=Rhizobium aethiopicum TaxID=1138170 RepID=UPI00161AF0CA|nr:hypothetical protein [Rhizobium aethiopicum]MBB4580379.1 hypothetical protein [Rhizobium aethiopicum]
MMEKACGLPARRAKREVWIGNELIRNAPSDPKDIVLLIRERRASTPAQKVRAKMAADLRERGQKP